MPTGTALKAIHDKPGFASGCLIPRRGEMFDVPEASACVLTPPAAEGPERKLED